MMRRIIPFVLLAAVISVCQTASAAVTAFNDFAAFQAATAGLGASTTVDFESTFGGLTTVNGVTFSSDEAGAGLQTGSVFTATGTNNAVGRGLFPIGLTDQNVTIDFGSPQNAAGLFVIFDDLLTTSTPAGSDVTLGGGGATASLSGATAFSTFDDPFVPPTDNSTFFLGLVDTMGTGALQTITLQGPGLSSAPFLFDDVISFAGATAIPEPSSLAGLALFATGMIARRRRR